MYDAIVLDLRDNVATAVKPLKSGQQVNINVNGERVTLVINEDVPFGHKFAIKTIAKGEEVIKYGEVIGIATQKIQRGCYVHIHNIIGRRGVRKGGFDGIKGV